MKNTILNLLEKTVPSLDASQREAMLQGGSLVTSGILDSLSLIGFVSELENEFGFEFSPEDMDLSHFETLASVELLISGKRRGE